MLREAFFGEQSFSLSSLAAAHPHEGRIPWLRMQFVASVSQLVLLELNRPENTVTRSLPCVRYTCLPPRWESPPASNHTPACTADSLRANFGA